MSSSASNDPEVTVIKSNVPRTESKTTIPKIELEGLGHELRGDLGKVGKGAMKGLGGFRTFILRGNVVDLAIGIVIGAAFTAVVNGLVSDIITPLIPVASGTSLSSLQWPLYGNPKAILNLGGFINAIISFLIVAAVLYFFVVQPVNRMMKLYHTKEDEAHETRDCPHCFQTVHLRATRCPYCTSQLTETAERPREKEPVLMLPEALEKLSDQLAERIVKKTTAALEKTAGPAGEGRSEKE